MTNERGKKKGEGGKPKSKNKQKCSIRNMSGKRRDDERKHHSETCWTWKAIIIAVTFFKKIYFIYLFLAVLGLRC